MTDTTCKTCGGSGVLLRPGQACEVRCPDCAAQPPEWICTLETMLTTSMVTSHRRRLISDAFTERESVAAERTKALRTAMGIAYQKIYAIHAIDVNMRADNFLADARSVLSAALSASPAGEAEAGCERHVPAGSTGISTSQPASAASPDCDCIHTVKVNNGKGWECRNCGKLISVVASSLAEPLRDASPAMSETTERDWAMECVYAMSRKGLLRYTDANLYRDLILEHVAPLLAQHKAEVTHLTELLRQRDECIADEHDKYLAALRAASPDARNAEPAVLPEQPHGTVAEQSAAAGSASLPAGSTPECYRVGFVINGHMQTCMFMRRIDAEEFGERLVRAGVDFTKCYDAPMPSPSMSKSEAARTVPEGDAPYTAAHSLAHQIQGFIGGGPKFTNADAVNIAEKLIEPAIAAAKRKAAEECCSQLEIAKRSASLKQSIDLIQVVLDYMRATFSLPAPAQEAK